MSENRCPECLTSSPGHHPLCSLRPRPEPRCGLTDLLVSQCSHCKAQTVEIRWFDAAYPGTCGHPGCTVPINVGDRIHQRPDGLYEHARCARRP